MESQTTPLFASSTIQDRLGLVPSLTFQHVFRAGGGDKGSDQLDYAVLSVAVATLALILVVELVRHKLDVVAIGRPFFKTVLEGVYGELATLGIVESFIFLLHKYYENLNVAQELVFADVHFTLFFTAIFNALMSVLLAFFTTRISNRLWVQTEYQDLYHYVEIREEFDRLDRELLNLAYRGDRSDLPSGQETSEHLETIYTNNSGRTAAQEGSTRVATDAEREFQFNCDSLRELCEDVFSFLRAPVLYQQHRNLLVQVRFHELKYQFIQAYDLPITMHVSTYLKRSELHVLQKLVNISTFAWLILTAGLNFLYFLMGMVITWTDGDNSAVGDALTIIFFLSMFFFVIMSFLIWNKMTWIFRQIIEGKLIFSQNPDSIRNATVAQRQDFERPTTTSNADGGFDQKSLFWGKSPRLIIILIQFMQFGFAVALSVLLIFWDDIDVEGASVSGEFFLLCVLVCYVIFVYCMANVLPRYTLCSNLGQLVNNERLHETLARHRLEESQRKRQQLQVEKELEGSIEWEDDSESDSELSATTPPALNALKSLGNAVIDFATNEKPKPKPIIPETKDNAAMFAELVRTQTKELRSQLPVEAKLGLEERRNQRERQFQARRNRRKSISDGVEAMRAIASLTLTGSNRSLNTSGSHDSESSSKASATMGQDRRSGVRRSRGRRRKAMSASADIQMMRDSLDGSKVSTGSERRRQRVKSSSASEDIRNMRQATILEEEESQQQQDSLSPSKPGGHVRRNSADLAIHHASQKRLEDLLGEQGIDAKELRRGTVDTEPKKKGDDDICIPNSITKEGTYEESAATMVPPLTVTSPPLLFGNTSNDYHVSLTDDSMGTSDSATPLEPPLLGVAAKGKTNHNDLLDDSSGAGSLFGLSKAKVVSHHAGDHVTSLPDSQNTTSPPQTYLPRVIFETDPITQPSFTRGRRKNWKRASLGQSEGSIDLFHLVEEDKQSKKEEEEQKHYQFKSNTDEMTTMRTEDDETSESGSDNVDVPDVAEQGNGVKRKKKQEKKRSLYDLTRSYFRGRQYVITSAVFGTMVCFFLVGMRIEGILLETGVLKDLENTWQFQTELSFWIEFCWLVCFLISDLMIIYIFRPSQCFDERDHRAFAAGLIDIAINATCLALFIVAEVFRCCDDPDARSLAEADKETSSTEKIIEIECCPPFGKRLYGGVGPIEPFTALVALRIFRFWMGNYLSPKLEGFLGSIRSKLSFHSGMTDDNGESVRNPIDPLYDLKHGKRKLPERDRRDDHHHSGDFRDERGSIVELWKTALTNFPGIVSQHGEFSGELLQAMLGMEILEMSEQNEEEKTEYDAPLEGESIEHLPTVNEGQDEDMSRSFGYEADGDAVAAAAATTRAKRSNRRSSIQQHNTPPVEASNEGPRRRRLSTRQSIKMIGNQFTGLSAETQSIILAGKVGKTVRASRRSSMSRGLSTSMNFEGSLGSSWGDSSINLGDSKDLEGSSRLASKSLGAEFVVIDDNDALVDEADGHDFFAPNARLLRSMRRCDKKLLPYVSKWTMVDVVMTKYEIVYFDVTDTGMETAPTGTTLGDDNNVVGVPLNPEPKQKRMQTIKSAIEATRGGKGLRLKDVAFGRRVVGRLELSSVEAIHVERILPHEGGNRAFSSQQKDKTSNDKNNNSSVSDEYWRPFKPKTTACPSREVRWSKVKEDHLKVETKHDTLYLRFYGDLDNCEHNLDRMMKESELEGALFKNNAFQWCQTIVRIVGADRLNQAVAHIGSEDENDELREFLVIVEPENATGGGKGKGFGFRKGGGATSRRGFGRQVSG